MMIEQGPTQTVEVEARGNLREVKPTELAKWLYKNVKHVTDQVADKATLFKEAVEEAFIPGLQSQRNKERWKQYVKEQEAKAKKRREQQFSRYNALKHKKHIEKKPLTAAESKEMEDLRGDLCMNTDNICWF